MRETESMRERKSVCEGEREIAKLRLFINKIERARDGRLGKR